MEKLLVGKKIRAAYFLAFIKKNTKMVNEPNALMLIKFIL